MNVTVYCSARRRSVDDYGRDVEAIGRYLGENGHTLVFGGVDFGLMRVIAKATKLAGGKVVGVLPERRRLDECEFNDVTLHVPDLSERKEQMTQMADCFIVLPGGYGTIDELFSSFAALNFNDDKKRKIIILNINGIYSPILEQFRLFAEHGLFDANHLSRIIETTSAQECIDSLKTIATHINHEKE